MRSLSRKGRKRLTRQQALNLSLVDFRFLPGLNPRRAGYRFLYLGGFMSQSLSRRALLGASGPAAVGLVRVTKCELNGDPD